jgi:hypothetical protein
MEESTVLEERPRGFLQHLAGVFVSPGTAFMHILRRPGFWAPLVGYMAVMAVFTAVWTAKVDPREFMKIQIEESGRADQIPPDRMDEVLDQQARMFPIFAWLGPIFVPVIILVVSGALLFVYRFFMSADVGFRQSMTIVAWTFFAVSIVVTALMLLVLSLKGEWNVNPQQVLQANLAAVLDKESTPRPLYVLAGSFDLFSFWTMWLLASGFAIPARRSTGSAAWGVIVPWACWVLGKTALSALMPGFF